MHPAAATGARRSRGRLAAAAVFTPWLAAAVAVLAPWLAAAGPAGAAAPAAAPAPATASGHSAAPGPAAAAAPDRFAPLPGSFAVEAMDLDWTDQDRHRALAARLYAPKRAAGPFPVVVFSPGIGAGRGSLEFLGRHLASHGYVSVHLQHPGGDQGTSKSGGDAREEMMKAARDPKTRIALLLDLVFALDQVAALQATSPALRGRLDLAAVAVGGQSLGAWTVLSAAGLATVGEDGEENSLPDPRVKAALLFMPPAAPKQRQKLRFEHIKVPCLHVIAVPAGATQDPQAAERRLAFERIAGADQVLVTLLGGGAAPAAAGAGKARPFTADPQLQDQLKTIATAFLDANLRHDAAARKWLAGGGLAAALGKSGRVETRSPSSR